MARRGRRWFDIRLDTTVKKNLYILLFDRRV